MKSVYDLLGADFQCEQCGRRHSIGVGELVLSEEAISRLPEVCSRYVAGRRVGLVADQRTHLAAGELAFLELAGAGFPVVDYLIADPSSGHWPFCDDLTRDRLERELGECDLLVAVGGGVISDIV